MNEDLATIAGIQFVLNSPNFYFDKRNFNNDLKNLLNRIRNGISHQRIETITIAGKWKGVIIEDYDRQNNLGLHLELKTSELRKLAFFISDAYLNEIGN